jgi:hypothetical protein
VLSKFNRNRKESEMADALITKATRARVCPHPRSQLGEGRQVGDAQVHAA